MRKWFNQLKVSQKLMLISIFFVMPDSLMLYLFISGINQDIRFTRWEQKGNAYQRPLENLLERLPEHQWLAQAPADPAPRLAKQAQIDTAFEQLAEVDARIGADLEFTDEGLAKRKREHCRVRTLRREWEALKAELPGLSSEACAAQHRHLMADLRTMITHAGDLSNLILDPNLDSYYLMDATLLALPETQDRLGMVLERGRAALERKTFSADEREQLAIGLTLLADADVKRVEDSLQTALNEDPNFYARSATLQTRVPPVLREFTVAAAAFNGLTTRLLRSDKMEFSAAEFVAAGEQARAASFKLWHIAAAELDMLLQKRIESYEGRRRRSLLVSALALLAACGLVAFITRSISGPLRQQAAELTAANESLQAEIAERLQAEAELAGAQQGLLESSRQAGMAEVATGVLHNVGNVLNSVNVASNCVADSLRKSKLVNLGRVVALFREHEADLGHFLTQDPKGRQVPGYLAQLNDHLANEQAAALRELSGLQKDIEHIKDIVSMQQGFAKVVGVKVNVSAVDLLEDALRMNISSIQRHDVQVIREFEPAPPVVVEKHKALQILVNLIRNAKQSCDEANREAKQLTLRVRHGAEAVQLSVTDNGVGIPAENLARIFNHGFTTKQDGHGFGLHSAANAAKEMGGSLRVHSDGAGRGATFTLELPLEAGDRNRLPGLAEPMVVL